MVAANNLLYAPAKKGEKKGEHPDHLVVIKYAPAVGDDKRALDEYYSELLMGGRNTLSVFNICEVSLAEDIDALSKCRRLILMSLSPARTRS